MKRLLSILLLTTTLITISCSPYDDTELWDNVNKLNDRVKTIETLLSASANNLTIKSVLETTAGLVITFSNNSSITIKQDISDSPIANVQQDGDMVYITLKDGTILTFRKYEINDNCKVFYTSTDGKMILNDEGFGAILISSTYENGQGVLTFDKPITSIGSYYENAKIKSITIPETVTQIGSFYNCTNLTKVYCKAITPPSIGYYAFHKQGANSASKHPMPSQYTFPMRV